MARITVEDCVLRVPSRFELVMVAAQRARDISAGAIEFKTADALQRSPPAGRGTMAVNPPYGERIEAKGSVPAGAATAAGRAGTREEASAVPGSRGASAREGFEGGGAGGEFFAALA